MEPVRISYQETVDHVKAAIANDREMYRNVLDAVYCGAKEKRTEFAQLCIEFCLCEMQNIRKAWPWLSFHYEHVCDALDRIVSEVEPCEL